MKASDYVKMQLSEKVRRIPEALSVYMNNVVYEMKRRGDHIKVLSLGEAFFEIPMFSFEKIDFAKGYHYSESRGLYDLRKAIANYYNTHYRAPVDPDTEIIISAGSKPLIFMAIQAVLNPGDEVLIHEPAWLSYPEEIKLAGGEPRFIPYDCSVKDFSSFFTGKTRMLILCNPNNPAGRTYSRDELLYLYQLCRPKGIYILVDEAYSDFFCDDGFCSMANIVPEKDGIIVVNSLSKNMGISGWRVGYVISSPDVIFQVLKLNQHLLTCPATVLLLYLAEYFDDILNITLPQARAVVRKRAEIEAYCKEVGLAPLPGSATFYLFLHIGNYCGSSLDLALYLLMKYRISVVPGTAYGNSTERFIRIGIGAESLIDIKQALDTIKKVIDNNECDSDYVDNELRKLGMNRFETQRG